MSMVSGMVASSWMGNGQSFVKSLGDFGDFGDLVTTNPRHVRQPAIPALPAPHHDSTGSAYWIASHMGLETICV
jgi:hypothetical protein